MRKTRGGRRASEGRVRGTLLNSACQTGGCMGCRLGGSSVAGISYT